MALHSDLFSQARHLAERDPARPRQANLRRAVSAAYYALFHFLIDAACREFLGGVAADVGLREVMTRAFGDRGMKDASNQFQSGNLPKGWANIFAGNPIPSNLRIIARTFVEAQEKRHEADYDLSIRFIRPDVLAIINRVDRAINIWQNLSGTREARLYLISLLAWLQIQGK